MRLYLSSFLFGAQPEKLLALVGGAERSRVALILNALDNFPQVRQRFEKEQTQAFYQLGFQAVEELDLRLFFKGEQGLASVLERQQLIWVNGGNSFLLRRAMYQSGFDVLLKRYLEQDTCVYGGFSAGAVVAGPTLRGFEYVDQPFDVSAGYQNEVIWEGLNLLERSVLVHDQSEHPEAEKIKQTKRYCEAHQYPYYALQDGQVLIREDEQIQIL